MTVDSKLWLLTAFYAISGPHATNPHSYIRKLLHYDFITGHAKPCSSSRSSNPLSRTALFNWYNSMYVFVVACILVCIYIRYLCVECMCVRMKIVIFLLARLKIYFISHIMPCCALLCHAMLSFISFIHYVSQLFFIIILFCLIFLLFFSAWNYARWKFSMQLCNHFHYYPAKVKANTVVVGFVVAIVTLCQLTFPLLPQLLPLPSVSTPCNCNMQFTASCRFYFFVCPLSIFSSFNIFLFDFYLFYLFFSLLQFLPFSFHHILSETLIVLNFSQLVGFLIHFAVRYVLLTSSFALLCHASYMQRQRSPELARASPDTLTGGVQMSGVVSKSWHPFVICFPIQIYTCMQLAVVCMCVHVCWTMLHGKR